MSFGKQWFGRIHNFLTVENYVDFHIQSEEDSNGLGDFGTSIKWHPSDRFSANFDLLLDANDMSPNIFRTGFTYMASENTNVNISYYHRDDFTSRDLFSNGSNLSANEISSHFRHKYQKAQGISASFSYLINSKTLLRTSVSYSLLNNEIARAFIELQRKLHCWTMSLRYEIDEDEETNIMLNFYLNAYPNASIGTGN